MRSPVWPEPAVSARSLPNHDEDALHTGRASRLAAMSPGLPINWQQSRKPTGAAAGLPWLSRGGPTPCPHRQYRRKPQCRVRPHATGLGAYFRPPGMTGGEGEPSWVNWQRRWWRKPVPTGQAHSHPLKQIFALHYDRDEEVVRPTQLYSGSPALPLPPARGALTQPAGTLSLPQDLPYVSPNADNPDQPE